MMPLLAPGPGLLIHNARCRGPGASKSGQAAGREREPRTSSARLKLHVCGRVRWSAPLFWHAYFVFVRCDKGAAFERTTSLHNVILACSDAPDVMAGRDYRVAATWAVTVMAGTSGASTVYLWLRSTWPGRPAEVLLQVGPVDLR